MALPHTPQGVPGTRPAPLRERGSSRWSVHVLPACRLNVYDPRSWTRTTQRAPPADVVLGFYVGLHTNVRRGGGAWCGLLRYRHAAANVPLRAYLPDSSRCYICLRRYNRITYAADVFIACSTCCLHHPTPVYFCFIFVHLTLRIYVRGGLMGSDRAFALLLLVRAAHYHLPAPRVPLASSIRHFGTARVDAAVH